MYQDQSWQQPSLKITLFKVCINLFEDVHGQEKIPSSKKLFELNDRFISVISAFEVKLGLKAKINLQRMIKSGENARENAGYVKICTKYCLCISKLSQLT